MDSTTTHRRIQITPAVSGDSVLESFLHSLDQSADIQAYLHESPPQMNPSTEVMPSDHSMSDGRTAYVFRMGRPQSSLRDFIFVVTSVNGKLVATSA